MYSDQEIEKLIEDISSDDRKTVRDAGNTLQNAMLFRKQYNIIPFLVEALGEVSEKAKITVAGIFANLSMNDIHIGGAVHVLIKCLDSENINICSHCKSALVGAVIHEKSREMTVGTLINALECGNESIKKNILWIFQDVTNNGVDIIEVLPALIKLMRDDDAEIWNTILAILNEMSHVDGRKIDEKVILELQDELEAFIAKIKKTYKGNKVKQEAVAQYSRLARVIRKTIHGLHGKLSDGIPKAPSKGRKRFVRIQRAFV